MNSTTYPNLKQSLVLVILFFLSFALFFFLTLTIPQLFEIKLSKLYISIIFSIGSPIASLPIIIYVSKKSGIRPLWPLKFPGIFLITLLAMLAISVKIITDPLNSPKEFINSIIDGKLRFVVFSIKGISLVSVIRFILTVFLVPIFEEIFWRKQILGLLLRKYSPLLSIVLSSLFFAIAHLRFNDIITLFIWGLVFGAVYYRTSLLEASILLHSFAIGSGYFIKNELFNISDLQILKYVLIMFICVATILLIIRYLERHFSSKKFSFHDPAAPE